MVSRSASREKTFPRFVTNSCKRSNSFAVRFTSLSPIETERLFRLTVMSRTITVLCTFSRWSIALRRKIVFIRALTSRILKGFVI